MFDALNHNDVEDHLDLSFRDTRRWPKVGPGPGMPPSLFVSLGDVEAGPDVQFAVMEPAPSEMWLDTHYHATDQFRAVLQGEFKIQRKHMVAMDFGYQSPGIPYREGVPGGATSDMWMMMVHGERRGARSTMTRTDGNIIVGEFGEDQLDRPVPVPEDPYWADVPGGAKGRLGLSTTIGRQVGGFAWGNFDASTDWIEPVAGIRMAAGLLGDPDVGPVVVTLHAAPDVEIFEASSSGTEIVLTVVRGACEIDGQRYTAGDVRIQKANAPMGALKAGYEGADIILVLADRREVFSKRMTASPLIEALERLLVERLIPALP